MKNKDARISIKPLSHPYHSVSIYVYNNNTVDLNNCIIRYNYIAYNYLTAFNAEKIFARNRVYIFYSINDRFRQLY